MHLNVIIKDHQIFKIELKKTALKTTKVKNQNLKFKI